MLCDGPLWKYIVRHTHIRRISVGLTCWTRVWYEATVNGHWDRCTALVRNNNDTLLYWISTVIIVIDNGNMTIIILCGRRQENRIRLTCRLVIKPVTIKKNNNKPYQLTYTNYETMSPETVRYKRESCMRNVEELSRKS